MSKKMKDKDVKNQDLYDFLVTSELAHYYTDFTSRLKVTTIEQIKYVDMEDLRDIGMTKPEQRRLKKLYGKEHPKGTFGKLKRSILKKEKSNSRPSLPMPLSVYETTKFGRHIIPAEALSIHKEIGKGEFGIVQQGVWTNEEGERIQVAIKCLSKDKLLAGQADFLKEATIMHSLDHEHLVRLYGVVLDVENSLMLVTELAPLRSLSECLKEPSLRSYFPVIQLCDFCTQIARGMKYLHSKNVIHRDLATRNILVFSRDMVKISDFGLSRALGVGKDYYQTNFNVNLKLPLAWCAPECINYLKFTSSSDIWGFGVTSWEIFTYGFQPWAALTGSQILQAIDSPNFQRLEKPDCAPTQYYDIMLRCWEHDPGKRPTFFELVEELPKARPMQMKALTDFQATKPEHLSYKENDVITVLDMRSSQEGWWKGVIGSGKTGAFNTDNTMAYDPSAPSNQQHQQAQQKQLQQQQQQLQHSSRFKIYKKAEKPKSPQKHAKKGKLGISRDMISQPQGDLQHLAHIGIEAQDTFGDITFLQDKYHLLPKTMQEKLDHIDTSKPSPFRRTLTLPVGKEMKSRTPDLIDVPLRSPQSESQSSLPDSTRAATVSPKRIPLVLPTKGRQIPLKLGDLPPKKSKSPSEFPQTTTDGKVKDNGRQDRTLGYFDSDKVDSAPERRKEDAEVSMITSAIFDDDLTPPTTPCPDSPTESLNLHFDLGPSLLDDVLSAWDNSKSTLESQFTSSDSPPKSESSFTSDSPPKRGSSKKILERQSSSTSHSSEASSKPLVNPIKKPKRSFRKDHPQKHYVMNVTDSPVSSPEVEAVPLPGNETSVKGFGDPFGLATDPFGVSPRDVGKTGGGDVQSSLRKRDSDTESTDYLQLMDSTIGTPEDAEETPKQPLESSGVGQSDKFEEKPVFLQRTSSKREVITQEGMQAYEHLVGSKKSIKRKPIKIPSDSQQTNGVESPSRTPTSSPVKTQVTSPVRTQMSSPIKAPLLPPTQTSVVPPLQTSVVTSERPPIASPDRTPVASPSWTPVSSPIKIQSKSTSEPLSPISLSSRSSVRSTSVTSDSSTSRSIASPLKTEAELQYADLLHDTSGEDTIDLSNPENFSPGNKRQTSSAAVSFGAQSQPSEVYSEVQVVSARRGVEDEAAGDFDRSNDVRSSARDIIKRFEQKSQPVSVRLEDPLPKKRGVKNLKDLFTMDTTETAPSKETSPPKSPEMDRLPPLPARKYSSEDDNKQDDSDIGLSPATLKNLTQSTRRTRRPVGEKKIKRRSTGETEMAEVLKARTQKDEGSGEEERRKQERQISLERQKSTEEVMKTRPLPELPEPEDKNNNPNVEHDYEMIEIPAVPPRVPLNPQWPSKKRRSRKSSKSQGSVSSPTKSSSSASSLQQSGSEPGTPETPHGLPASLYMNPSNGEWDARTKFLLQKSVSLDIYSDGDLVRSSPEEIRRHLKNESAKDKQEKSLLKTASLDRNSVLTRSSTNPTLSSMDMKEDGSSKSGSVNKTNESPPQRSHSYEDVLENILDGSLPQAESLTDVLKRTYRTQDASPPQSDASSVASAGSLEKVTAAVETTDKTALDGVHDEGYLDMTGKHSSVAMADYEWTDTCQEVQEVRKAMKDKMSISDIVTALKCNNWDVEMTVQDIKIQHLQNRHLGDERRCRHTLIRYNWDLDKALNYLINNPYRQSEL